MAYIRIFFEEMNKMNVNVHPIIGKGEKMFRIEILIFYGFYYGKILLIIHSLIKEKALGPMFKI